MEQRDDSGWLGSRTHPLAMRRRVLFVRRGQAGIEQTFETAGDYDSTLVTASGWFASVVVVHEGTLGFLDGRGTRAVGSARFLLYLPSGSLVRMPLQRARVHTLGITGSALPPGWPTLPLAIPCELNSADATQQSQVAMLLQRVAQDRELVERYRVDADHGVAPSLSSLRRSLFETALRVAPVGRVAEQKGLDPSVLCRTFSQAFGISPRTYCQRVRIHAAVLSLIEGLSIAEVALGSGFRDLSRFYRQFRRVTTQTPGSYRVAGLSSRKVK